MGKDRKSVGRDISGWGTFFLFQIGLCAIILVMSFISNFSLLNYDIGVSKAITQMGIACDIISISAIAVYAILVIRSFIKRKTFTIQLAMSYLFALFLNENSELLGTLLSYNINMSNLLSCIIGMIWFVIWLIYLYYSKQIEKLFPISTMLSRKRNYLPIILIACPPIIWKLIIIGYYLY